RCGAWVKALIGLNCPRRPGIALEKNRSKQSGILFCEWFPAVVIKIFRTKGWLIVGSIDIFVAEDKIQRGITLPSSDSPLVGAMPSIPAMPYIDTIIRFFENNFTVVFIHENIPIILGFIGRINIVQTVMHGTDHCVRRFTRLGIVGCCLRRRYAH